jgi:N-methylhydantoinase B
MFLNNGGGPASEGCDGWSGCWQSDVCAGVIGTESVELHELMAPHFVKKVAIWANSCGAGKYRGGIGGYFSVQPIKTRVLIAIFGDGKVYPARGVLGGKDTMPNHHFIVDAKTGEKKRDLPLVGMDYCEEDEEWHCYAQGGGGFGDPLERDPEAVRWDVGNDYVSLEAARDVYGVVLKMDTELYEVDYDATKRLRKDLGKTKGERR